MRTLLFFVATALMVAVFSPVAFAQQDAGDGPAVRQGDEKPITPEKFTAVKSRVLAMIEKRQTRLSEEKACVEAATTPQELRKCRPAHPTEPGGRHRGPGQRPPMEQQ